MKSMNATRGFQIPAAGVHSPDGTLSIVTEGRPSAADRSRDSGLPQRGPQAYFTSRMLCGGRRGGSARGIRRVGRVALLRQLDELDQRGEAIGGGEVGERTIAPDAVAAATLDDLVAKGAHVAFRPVHGGDGDSQMLGALAPLGPELLGHNGVH